MKKKMNKSEHSKVFKYSYYQKNDIINKIEGTQQTEQKQEQYTGEPDGSSLHLQSIYTNQYNKVNKQME